MKKILLLFALTLVSIGGSEHSRAKEGSIERIELKQEFRLPSPQRGRGTGGEGDRHNVVGIQQAPVGIHGGMAHCLQRSLTLNSSPLCGIGEGPNAQRFSASRLRHEAAEAFFRALVCCLTPTTVIPSTDNGVIGWIVH